MALLAAGADRVWTDACAAWAAPRVSTAAVAAVAAKRAMVLAFISGS